MCIYCPLITFSSMILFSFLKLSVLGSMRVLMMLPSLSSLS